MKNSPAFVVRDRPPEAFQVTWKTLVLNVLGVIGIIFIFVLAAYVGVQQDLIAPFIEYPPEFQGDLIHTIIFLFSRIGFITIMLAVSALATATLIISVESTAYHISATVFKERWRAEHALWKLSE